MNPAGTVSIHSARLSQIGVNRQVLKEGASVLVRVIADRGGGKYEGSVAGVRVQLTSAKALRPGDSFAATISVKNGTVIVTPKDNAGVLEMPLTFTEVSQSQLVSLLETLGLPADNLSASILQAFKQMGLKMDSALLGKIRSLALRFAGKEKSAAELLSLLAQKGLEADEEEIKQLLALLDGEENSSSDNQNHHSNTNEKLVNRINSSEGAWYLLPFELVQLGPAEDVSAERAVLGNGCIRLLYDTSAMLKMLNLDCRYNNQKYLFSLLYEGKKIKKTYFNVSSILDSEASFINAEAEVLELKKRFMAAGINPGKIAWADKDEIDGNASGLESFVSFGGEV